MYKCYWKKDDTFTFETQKTVNEKLVVEENEPGTSNGNNNRKKATSLPGTTSLVGPKPGYKVPGDFYFNRLRKGMLPPRKRKHDIMKEAAMAKKSRPQKGIHVGMKVEVTWPVCKGTGDGYFLAIVRKINWCITNEYEYEVFFPEDGKTAVVKADDIRHVE